MPRIFPSISSLIPLLPNDDYDSWEKLISRFQTGMISKARSLLRSSNLQRVIDAEDLVQDAFKNAWLNFASFRGKSTAEFAKWLITILRNRFLSCCRTQPQVGTSENSFSKVPSTYACPEQQAFLFEQEAMLHACIAELEPEDQLLISLKHFEGLTFRQIAKHLHSSASTICGKYNRAMDSLSKLLKSESFNVVIR